MLSPKTTNSQIMQRANAPLEQAVALVRADDTRTDQWKVQQIAAAFVRARAERDRLVAERDAARRANQRTLEGKVFGAPGSSADAAWAISRRDAAERAATIDTEQAAAQMLERAERQQDEPLARAVVERAYEMRWLEVANSFADTRPELQEAMSELWTQQHPSFAASMEEGFVLQSGTPVELRGLNDFQIRALADLAEV